MGLAWKVCDPTICCRSPADTPKCLLPAISSLMMAVKQTIVEPMRAGIAAGWSANTHSPKLMGGAANADALASSPTAAPTRPAQRAALYRQSCFVDAAMMARTFAGIGRNRTGTTRVGDLLGRSGAVRNEIGDHLTGDPVHRQTNISSPARRGHQVRERPRRTPSDARRRSGHRARVFERHPLSPGIRVIDPALALTCPHLLQDHHLLPIVERLVYPDLADSGVGEPIGGPVHLVPSALRLPGPVITRR